MTSTEVNISGPQTFPVSESDIRVDYNDPTKIVAAANRIGQNNQGMYYSVDGGVSWSQTSLPLAAGDSFHSDPTVDWTSNGTAWATTIGMDNALTNLSLRSYKSSDGGATWTFDGTISGNQTQADKQMMWVDHSPTSPFKDNIYVIWHNSLPVFVNRRTGGGWQTPIQVSGTETTGTGIGGDIKTNSAGDVFAFWPDTGSHFLFVAKSTDGGASFGAPVTIARTFKSYDIGVPSVSCRRALVYISGGTYRTAEKNLVHAVWTDLTGAPGCSSSNDEPCSPPIPPATCPPFVPCTNVSTPCKSRIWFSRSNDGGATWDASRMINDRPSQNDQFNPKLAVDETNGQLVVIYYDTVNDPGRLKTDVFVQKSSNDGLIWSGAAKVTSVQTDETASGADFGNQYGDYNGLSGYQGRFFPSWTDRSSGGSEEIHSARI